MTKKRRTGQSAGARRQARTDITSGNAPAAEHPTEDYVTASVLRAVSGRSLEEVDGQRWGPAPPEATGLIRRVHRMRTTPIRQLDVDDLGTLVRQEMHLDIVIPVALGTLRADPLAEGSYYPGYLLHAVLDAPPAWFEANPAVEAAIDEVVAAIDPDVTDGYGDPLLIKEVGQAIDRWHRRRQGETG